MYCVLLLYALVVIICYKADITRNSCRRDSLFKFVGKNVKLDATALKTVKVQSLVFCAKECLDKNTCRSFNYERPTRMCVVFATDNATTGSMIASSGWQYYEPVQRWGSARCRKLDSYPCQPTEKCVEDCQTLAGYKCEALTNIALRKPAIQAKDYPGRPASRAVDGNLATNWAYSSCTHADYSNGVHAWWRVSFGKTARVYTVKITNRSDCCGSRLSNFDIRIGDSTTGRGGENAACATKASVPTGATSAFRCYPYMDGKYLYLQDNLASVFTICETQVFGELLN